MPSISRRGMDMPQSPIRKLVPYCDEAKKRGVKVYQLNIGQPDLPAVGAVKQLTPHILFQFANLGTQCRL